MHLKYSRIAWKCEIVKCNQGEKIDEIRARLEYKSLTMIIG